MPATSPSTLLGGDGVITDMLDPTQPPLATDYEVVTLAGDVDGDGTMDLIARVSDCSLLMVGKPDRLQPLDFCVAPSGTVNRYYPVTDVHNDGHADVLASLTRMPAIVGPLDYPPGDLALYAGGPGGYDDEPQWTLELDGLAMAWVAVQADADPELEIVVVVSDWTWPYYVAIEPRIALVDEVHTDSPSIQYSTSVPTLFTDGGTNQPLQLTALGDLDGDGLDEVLLAASRQPAPTPTDPYATADLKILSALHDYDQTLPVLTLSLDHPTTDQTSHLRALPVDADGDGHLDLVATTGGADNMMQVWFGPLIEPLPDTGDTGTAPTGTTGTTAATGHTGTRAETGATASDSAPPDTGSPAQEPAETETSAEAGACGCQTTGSSLWAVAAPWARR